MNKIERLAKAQLFAKLSATELIKLTEGGEEVIHEAGEYIYRQGEIGNFFYVVLEGDVELVARREDSTAGAVGRIGAGGHFGECSLLADQIRSVSVRAMSRVNLLRFSKDFFRSNLLTNRKFHRELDRSLANRLRLAFRDQVDTIFERRQSLQLREAEEEIHPLIDVAPWHDPEAVDKKKEAGSASKSSRDIQASIRIFAEDEAPLLIIGESGTGRRLTAKQIHFKSAFRHGPFIEADLRQFEPGIWEGKLFGQDRNAFPFSQVRESGILEQFRSGTIVLHHAEYLPDSLQEKLFEAVQRGFFYRVEGQTPLSLKARLIFICGGENPESPPCRFIPGLQKSFFDRTLFIPALRGHKRDIPRLAEHYLKHFNREYGKNVKAISTNALGVLMNYDWPGNLTELSNVIQRAVLLAEEDEILTEQILLGLPQPEGKREYNLLRWRTIRRFFNSQLFPILPRILISIVFFCGLLALFLGPREPERNIGLVMSWAIGWPLLLFSFFFLGRIWCSVCSFSLPGNLIQRLSRPQRNVPRFIADYSGWIMASLCIIVFWIEIVWDAYRNARLTGYIILAIISGAFLFSLIFKRRAWCRYVCPLGGLNAIFAMPSVTELRANRHLCLNRCQTHACYKGEGEHEGCPMFRHPFLVDNNRDCILCANCIKNCPHDSIQFNLRIAPQELWLIQSPRTADSFLVVTLAAIFLPFAWHNQFQMFISNFPSPHLKGTLILSGLIALFLAAFASFSWLQGRITQNGFGRIFAATGYGLIPLVVGAYLAIYFDMFLAGSWRIVPLLLSPFNHMQSAPAYQLLSEEATATLQHLIITGGLLASFYATYRIVRRYTLTNVFSLKFYALPYGFLLGIGVLFLLLI